MVWAIRFEIEFNEFFPRGGFRGYKAALAAHYKAEEQPGLTPRHPPNFIFTSERPLDGDGNPYATFSGYSSDVSEKFHAELGVRRPHEPPLDPVQPHEWPAEYVYEKVYKRDAAMAVFTNRMYAVTGPLREIIERLEPGVHQFHPIRALLPKGLEHPVSHYVMIVGRWLSSFRLKDSDPGCISASSGGGMFVKSDTKQCYAGVAMATAEIGDAHLWCERQLIGPTFFLSDRLKEEVEAAGLRLPPHFKMKSV